MKKFYDLLPEFLTEENDLISKSEEYKYLLTKNLIPINIRIKKIMDDEIRPFLND
jgi:hypothetical protein